MIRFVLCLCVCASATGYSFLAAASQAIPAEVAQAVARVTNMRGSVGTTGTGTLVAKGNQRGLVLTAAHIFPEGAANIVVRFPNGETHTATLLAADAAYDLAMLEITEPRAEPVAIAEQTPVTGDAVCLLGYGPGYLGYRVSQALDVCVETTHHTYLLSVTGGAMHGDSGGPMLDRRWQVCGVILGTNGKETDSVMFPRVRAFCDRFRSRCQRSRCQRSPWQPGSCQSGTCPLPNAGNTVQGNTVQPPAYQSQAATPPSVQQPPATPAPPPVVDSTPWTGERAMLQRQHEQAMQHKAQQVAALQRRLEAERAATQAGLEKLPPRVTPERPVDTTPILERLPPVTPAAEAVSHDLTPLLIARGLVALGVPSVLAGVAGIGLGWGVMRLLRGSNKRHTPQPLADWPDKTDAPRKDTRAQQTTRAQPQNAIEMPPVVAIDQRHHNVISYVPDNTADRMWAEAVRRYSEHYPGTAETLRGVVRLKDQLLKGEPSDIGVSTR